MDALLLSLILCALAEVGRGMEPQGRAPFVIIVVCAANALIAALAGMWLLPMLTPEARLLFLAAALMAAGFFHLLASPKQAVQRDAAPHAAHTSWISTLARHFLGGLSGSAPLLIAALAVAFADPWMAGIGGALGCGAAGFFGYGRLASWVAGAVRYGGGGLMLGAGFLIGMAGLRLI